MNGIIIIDKEKGFTSRDIVNKVSKRLKTKKVGHTGTLDPIATGVLVVCVNKATKLVSRITDEYKEYVASCLFGISTDTIDIEGKVLKDTKSIISKEDIINTLNSFKGKYRQQVPIYSAVKINGKKLYEYARNNIEVSLPYREVEIKDIDLIEGPVYKNDKTEIKFKCNVSKGTYIRSLIRDIAEKLNTCAIMTELRRVKQGKYSISNSIKVDDVNIDSIIPIKDVLDVYKVNISDDIKKKVLNGAKINNIYNRDEVLFIDNDKEIALYKVDEKDKSFLKIDIMF